MQTDNEQRIFGYFAAANSSGGFYSLYNQTFARADTVYIIKGGPGTGKSRFMRESAEYAAARGYTREYIYCSSDPDSLDGVILSRDGKNIAIADGTSPHVLEPTLPGAREEIINFGGFWDHSALSGMTERITGLNRRKSLCMNRGYHYLRAAGEFSAVCDSMAEEGIDRQKLRATAEKLICGISGGSGDITVLFCDSIGMKGIRHLDTFERFSAETVYVRGHRTVSAEIMSIVSGIIRERNICAYIALDPLVPEHIRAIMLPDTGLSVICDSGGVDGDGDNRMLSLRGCINSKAEQMYRSDMNMAVRQIRILTAAAVRMFAGAADAHFELEKIYSEAMDFSKKEKLTEEFLAEVFGS